MRYCLANDWRLVTADHSNDNYLIGVKPYRQHRLNTPATNLLTRLIGGFLLEDAMSDWPDGPTAGRNGKTAAFVQRLLELGVLVREGDPKATGTPAVTRIRTNPPLRRVFLELTGRCNLRCAHCYGSFGTSSGDQELNTTEVVNLIEEAVALGVYEFDLTGGEPLLRQDMPVILERLTAHGIGFNLFTNASLLNEVWVERLAQSTVRSVVVSLDGLNPATHDRFRGVPGAWDKTAKALNMLKASGVKTRINVTATNSNFGELEDLAAWIEDNYGHHLVIAGIMETGRGTGSAERASLDDLADLIYRVNKQKFEAEKAAQTPLCSSTNPKCGVGRTFVFVTATGLVTPCPTLTQREDPRFVAGSIREATLAEIWETSDVFRSFRDLRCADAASCPWGDVCGGGCRSRSWLETGDLYGRDEIMCKVFLNNKREWDI